MKPSLRRVWQWARWPLFILGAAYVAVVLYRVWAIGEEEKTQQAVAHIHAQKITLADVMGNNLPPPPNKQENDATVEGVDVNNNGVRDDVELAIFEKYPDSPRVRAAQLQYAMALQMELTEVFNSETLVAVLQKRSKASLCVTNTAPRIQTSDDPASIKAFLKISDDRKKEVEDLVLNISVRLQTEEEIFQKFMVSYGDTEGAECDIDLNSLQN